MPFEPLRTDEKLSKPQKPEKTMDDLMLVGCTGFVSASLVTYALSVWPFFAFQTTHLLETLLFCTACGLVPAAVLGVYATRKFSLPGACGFVGGSMAVSVFLYLRLQQVMLGKGSTDLPHPDYPESFVWLVPLSWLVVCVLIALIAMPRSTDD